MHIYLEDKINNKAYRNRLYASQPIELLAVIHLNTTPRFQIIEVYHFFK